MKQLLLSITCIFFLLSAPKDKPIVEVEYFFQQYRINVNSEQKFEVKRVKTKGDSLEYINDSMTAHDIARFISFSSNVTVWAGKKTSKMTFIINSTKRSQVIVNTPDTLTYQDNAWTSLREGKTSPIPSVELIYKETVETKDILGYKCKKFMAEDTIKQRKYEIWAAKSLPNTLLPFTGLKKFPHGILEAHETSGIWSINAIRIKLLN